MLSGLLLQFEAVNEALLHFFMYKIKFNEIKVGLDVKWWQGRMWITPWALGSISSRCLAKESALLPEGTLLGEERKPDSKEGRKSNLPGRLLEEIKYIEGYGITLP